MNLSVSAILLYSVVAAFILIYIPFIVVGYARMQAGYDRSAPRAMFDTLPTYAKRAAWAHQNAFETFMPYAAAAILAVVTGVSSNLAAIAAIGFVVARALYPVFYISELPTARSFVFGLGTLSTITLFVLSVLQVQ